MKEYFELRELTVTETQLQEIESVEISPTARKILQNANVPWAQALLDADANKAAQAARELIRHSFNIEKG